MLSPAIENYLKALYHLEVPGQGVATSDLAARLQVRSASVTNMLQRLADSGLVSYRRYYGASLTDEGRRTATAVIRRHRILELFLHRMCGLGLDQVHHEAEMLEHAASDIFVDALERLLGFPHFDPHGDPIPDREGKLRDDASHALTLLPEGMGATVSRVEDSRPEALQHLMKLGLVPGARIALLRRTEFDGSVELRVGKTRAFLSRELASKVRVTPERGKGMHRTPTRKRPVS